MLVKRDSAGTVSAGYRYRHAERFFIMVDPGFGNPLVDRDSLEVREISGYPHRIGLSTNDNEIYSLGTCHRRLKITGNVFTQVYGIIVALIPFQTLGYQWIEQEGI